MKNKHSKIPSWIALLMGLGSTMLVGFLKVAMHSYPHEAVIGGIVGITLGYIGKRVVQKHKSFNGSSEEYKGE